MNEDIPEGESKGDQVVLAKLKYKITYKLIADCQEVVDEFEYWEWFRLRGNGKTPSTRTVTAFRQGQEVERGRVDTHELGPDDDVCCGTVSLEVEYGLAQPFDEPVRKTGDFGMANRGTAGGRFSNTWTHRQGWDVTTGLSITSKAKSWGFDYYFVKGGCCETKDCVEGIKLNGIDGVGSDWLMGKGELNEGDN
jgi:hypothetical protein